VYDGRIRVVQAETVLRDIERLASMGARHITFGDPDFLNGRRHSLAIVRALHERVPQLTFDCTTKVEHVLEHADIWPPRAACSSSVRWRASTTRSSNGSTRATPPPRRCPPSSCCVSTGSRPGRRSCPSPHG